MQRLSGRLLLYHIKSVHLDAIHSSRRHTCCTFVLQCFICPIAHQHQTRVGASSCTWRCAAPLQALPVVCPSHITSLRGSQSALSQAPEPSDSWDWTRAPLRSAVPQKVLRELIKLAVALLPQSLMQSELVPSTALWLGLWAHTSLSHSLAGHAVFTHRFLDGPKLTQDLTSSTGLV